ncbi:MAG: exodeoxyribonuclease I [Phycisphaerales bacterium]|nr:exodeoxyribonuclease I [Phycisphaerales bacterium]
MSEHTFLWHDYETFGSLSRPEDRAGTVAPYRARPAQFAAIRTTMDLEEIGEPIEFHCQPSLEEPPSVDACLVTGITPQDTLERGLPERAFFERVLAQFTGGTCGVGWNNFGYDDLVTRFGFWRNLLLPVYDREYKNDRSRWDLLPAYRFAYATRPEEIDWPVNAEGRITMRLEDLAPANGFADHDAHDALGDVRATIHLARVFKERLPKLWAHVRKMNNQWAVKREIEECHEPLLLSDRWIGLDRCYGTVMTPILNRGKDWVFVDLHGDPQELLDLTAPEVHHRLYNRDEDESRLPIQKLRINQSPMIATCKVLQTDEAWERLGLDKETCRSRWNFVQDNHDALVDRLGEVLGEPPDAPEKDSEERLYGGRFPEDWEAKLIGEACRSGPEDLRRAAHSIDDERLEELLFRFLAREHPGDLTDEEAHRWGQHLQERMSSPGRTGVPRIQEALDRIEECRAEGRDSHVLDQVEAWTRELAARASVELPG